MNIIFEQYIISIYSLTIPKYTRPESGWWRTSTWWIMVQWLSGWGKIHADNVILWCDPVYRHVFFLFHARDA